MTTSRLDPSLQERKIDKERTSLAQTTSSRHIFGLTSPGENSTRQLLRITRLSFVLHFSFSYKGSVFPHTYAFPSFFIPFRVFLHTPRRFLASHFLYTSTLHPPPCLTSKSIVGVRGREGGQAEGEVTNCMRRRTCLGAPPSV